MAKVTRERRLGVSMASCVRVLEVEAEAILGSDSPTLSIELLGFELTHPVCVVPGELTVVSAPIEVAALPFHVAANPGEELFPVFEAELEVMALPKAGVSVALDGEYHPPGKAAGALADLLGLHRVADEAIDRYFAALTDRLYRRAADLDALQGVPI